MREIVLDTETTGLDPDAGHRLVEIACIELINGVPSGAVFHRYVNPERDIPPEAYAVHKLSLDFLGNKPLFADIADDFIAFMEDSPLIAHNAEFDCKFVNAELVRCGKPRMTCKTIDTVMLARQKFPGAPASLDALCKRFAVDNSARTAHGARLDAELLAVVYMELLGGRQHGLGLAASAGLADGGALSAIVLGRESRARAPRPHAPTDDELVAHAAFLEKLKDPLWTA
jgi:DNA polymerase-3 subunit epsilon